MTRFVGAMRLLRVSCRPYMTFRGPRANKSNLTLFG
jgi:hypothetical protein